MPKKKAVAARRCRVCGCTDGNCERCVERIGLECDWVKGQDLCTACAGPLRLARQVQRKLVFLTGRVALLVAKPLSRRRRDDVAVTLAGIQGLLADLAAAAGPYKGCK